MATPGAGGNEIRIADVIDGSKIGSLQVTLFILCAACLIMDGFDVQAVGYVAPSIIKEWKIPGSTLGNMLASGNFGVLVGSLLFTMLADKIGRRPVLIAATFYFSVLTLATGLVSSVQQMIVVRFVAGLGLGCIIPNATALIGEYSPRRLRVTLMATISVGFTAGAAFGGFVSALLIPAFGWRSVFYFGGAIPLVIAVLMVRSLPESLQFMALQGRKNRDRLAGWLTRIDPTVPVTPTTEYVIHEENRGGVPAMHLFREGRTLGTILLWVINFMNIFNLYVLSGWMPQVAAQLGYSTRMAVLMGTTVQVGGTLGTFWLTYLIGRLGFIRVLTPCFAVACISIALIGQPGLAPWLLFLIVFVAGSCVVGGQPTVNALSGSYYPTYLRSTGIGWGLGIGRAGAIVGPWLVGQFMAAKWSIHDIFYASAIPALISAIVMLSLHWVMRSTTSRARPSEIVAH
jgi:AAHS family 4-hydroxybenzoate transporter-like MFS transporter